MPKGTTVIEIGDEEAQILLYGIMAIKNGDICYDLPNFEGAYEKMEELEKLLMSILHPSFIKKQKEPDYEKNDF